MSHKADTKIGSLFAHRNQESRLSIRKQLPTAFQGQDNLTGVLQQALVYLQNTQSSTCMDMMENNLNSDGLFEEDRFRQKLLEALAGGDFRRIDRLVYLSIVNTTRLTLCRRPEYTALVEAVKNKFTLDLREASCPALLIPNTYWTEYPKLAAGVQKLIKDAKAEILGRLKFNGGDFILLLVGDDI